jgi:hypothetical protein
MRIAFLSLTALLACYGVSCMKQSAVSIEELEDRLSSITQKNHVLGKEIAMQRKEVSRVEAESRKLVDERINAKNEMEKLAGDAARIRQDFVSYRAEFLKAARLRAKGLKIPQIEVKGRVFKDVTVSDTADGVLSFTHGEGSSQVAMSELDEELQMLVGYDDENPQDGEFKPSPGQILSLAIEAGQKARREVYSTPEKTPVPVTKEMPVTRSTSPDRPAWMSRSSFEGPSIAPYGGPRRTVSRAN